MDSIAAELAPGKQAGPYQIVSELGRGGMGVVFRALDSRLGREVALKTVTGFIDAETRERFVREARAAARVRHPGIVQVHDAQVISGVPVVVFELVEGESLKKKIEASGPLGPLEAATVVRALAEAVAAAHKEGVIHRDLKPANVLLDRDGRPRLADFGLARDMGKSELTETGVAIGTPGYMAPEQAHGDKMAIDARTDVYGLGAVLYETLAGRPPFRGWSSLAILQMVISEPPEPPSSERLARGLARVPVDLEAICLKALEKKRDARYQSAQELAHELGAFLEGKPVRARVPGPAERARRFVRRHKLAISFGATVLAGAAAFVAYAVVSARKERARIEAEVVALNDRRAAPLLADLEHDLGELEEAHRAIPVIADAHLQSTLDTRGAVFEWGERAVCAAFAYRDAVGEEKGREPLFRALSSYALALEDLLEFQPARALWEEALAHRTNDTTAREHLALAVLRIKQGTKRQAAHDAMEMGHWKVAEGLWTSVLAEDPAFFRGYYYRALVRLQRKDDGPAIEDLTRVIALHPEILRPYVLRAQARLRRGDFVGAEADLEAARARGPSDGQAWIVAGDLRERHGDRSAARAAYERVLGNWDETCQSVAAVRLAELELLDGNWARAEELATRVVDIGNDLYAGYRWRAAARRKLGKDADAASDLEHFIEVAPPNDPLIEQARRAIEELRRR